MLATKTAIGEKDKRVVILSPVISTGVNRPITNEDEITGWQELAEVWAKVRPFKGDEAMIAEKLTETHNIEVTTNYRSDVTERMRLAIDTRVYNITSLPPTENRKRDMMIYAQLNDKETWT